MESSRRQLVHWIEAGAIEPERISRALRLTGVMPDGPSWRHFLDRLMLTLGALALVCAMVFFVAYNWDGMGRFYQFALVQLLLLLAVLLFWQLGTETLAAQTALFAAAILLGVLLALFGQTYQTGADTWQLFATWAALLLPFALLSRFSPLWLLLLALLNLAIILYFQIFRGLMWVVFSSTDAVIWLLLVLNTMAWTCWELAARRFEWLAHRWAVRMLALASGIPMTLLVLLAIFEPTASPVLAWLVFLAWLGAVYAIYRRLRPDLFMLAGACLAAIVCLTCLLGDFLLDTADTAGTFLLLSMLVLGQTAAAAAWLRRIHVELQT